MKPDPEIYLALAQLLPELRNDPGFAVDPEALAGLVYRDVFNAALNGQIEAERINGRWYVKRADQRKNAERLGVLPKPRIGRPPRRTEASASSSGAPTAGGKSPNKAKPARAKRAVPSSNAAAAVTA